MDRSIREAERAGDYQRVYAMLTRSGDTERAQALFLDHPIQIECTIQYRWQISSSGRSHDSTSGYNLEEVLAEFISKNIGVNNITQISRRPVYQILGREAAMDYGPLPCVYLNAEETQAIKDRIRNHPDYLRLASPQQLREARDADARDAEKAQRQIAQEQRVAEARRQRRRIESQFEQDSEIARNEIWALWLKHHKLPRPEFAAQVNHHPLRFVLFRLKDAQDLGHETVTGQSLENIWNNTEQKRYNIWRREHGY